MSGKHHKITGIRNNNNRESTILCHYVFTTYATITTYKHHTFLRERNCVVYLCLLLLNTQIVFDIGTYLIHRIFNNCIISNTFALRHVYIHHHLLVFRKLFWLSKPILNATVVPLFVKRTTIWLVHILLGI